MTQTRLYVYPEDEKSILHVISIGTKTDQNKDIQECKEYVKSIRKLRSEEKNG